MSSDVVVRFPPSPTGFFHVGSARTALFNYLFARHHGGKFLLRFEDTDQERSKKEYEENILDGMHWLGLDFDNEPWRQSERKNIYAAHIKKLLESGAAYLDDNAVRLKNPGKRVTFTDLIRGEVTFDTKELGDFVVARTASDALYHLTVVVDDAEMEITHVIRGEDHISNTPRQILIQEALGIERPQYAHIPLILAPDRSKLSKRHGAVALTEYRQHGYLPEAIVNFLATLGWSPQAKGLEQELFTLDELVKHFDLAQVQSGGAVFNLEKLDWFNREYLRQMSPAKLTAAARPFLKRTNPALEKLLPEIASRVSKLSELTAENFDYLFEPPMVNRELLKTTEFLPAVLKILEKIPEGEFTREKIKDALWDFATDKGRDKVLWPLRVALTGLERSPDPFSVAGALGKREAISRLTAVLE